MKFLTYYLCDRIRSNAIVCQDQIQMKNPPPIYCVYHWSKLGRAFTLLFLAFSVFYAVGVCTGQVIRGTGVNPMIILIALVLFIAGSLFAIYSYRAKISFTTEAIELHTNFTRKRLPPSGILGRREYIVRDEDGSTVYLKLEPNDDRLPTLEFQKNYYNFDDRFFRWFNELPDLDVEDKKKHKTSNLGLV